MKISHAAVPAVLLTLLVSSCGHKDSTEPAAASSATAASSAAVAPQSKAYDVGRTAIYKQAFNKFTGTGTPWQKACESTVDEWQKSDGSQSWWNRDQALKGCVDQGNSPAASTSATAAAPLEKCAPQGGNLVKIQSGDVTCANADVIAKRYDFQGEKYQQITTVDTWMCYTSTADTRPLILTCLSDKGAEFGVYPAA